MPGLPEVETIVRLLQPKIIGKMIEGFEVRGTRVLRYCIKGAVQLQKLRGRTIAAIERRGKYIVLQLYGGNAILFHLMMTGRLLLNPRDTHKYDRLLVHLSENNKLVFNDVRQFGFCRILSQFNELSVYDAASISFSEFRERLLPRRGIIKNILLNQKIIAGLGNIYSDEMLWQAGLHPLRKVNSLDKEEVRRLYQACRFILYQAIKKQGSSMRDYQKPDGTRGSYYEIRRVYHRTGEPCAREGAIIKRIIVGGRSAHFCPAHQK